ncbi:MULTISPECIES: DUF3040 domain-containing protein [Streptomyces]|uniref:DUF3040 domain-containing protein n=1 Tax=Streptomyces indiaensis TaxID=284033 RepID=A0ABN3DJM4_9ACTN|nr:DUF3040 domain-containing protein [Streptomyces indiaensis]MCF1647070.1 DUF3040 domain-containing protein [Streptomyces indiaensis]
MPPSEDHRLVDLEARLEREDPRFVRGMSSGRPARPREYRRTGAWWGLALGVALLVSGIAWAQGLLIAGGLVLVGMAAQLADPDPARMTHRGFGRR